MNFIYKYINHPHLNKLITKLNGKFYKIFFLFFFKYISAYLIKNIDFSVNKKRNVKM